VPIEAQRKPDGGRWTVAPTMQTKGSKFVKFQEARLQESADEVPEGATPRTLSLHLRGEVTRSLKAGDSVVLAGVFLPEPFSGWKAMRWAAGDGGGAWGGVGGGGIGGAGGWRRGGRRRPSSRARRPCVSPSPSRLSLSPRPLPHPPALAC
jgi:hypothetical protein